METIRPAGKEDAEIAASLAVQMWKEHSVQELADEFAELLGKEDAVIFLLQEQDKPVGFAQCQLRHDYVEGTDSSPVGYLEGIFVLEEARRKGFARKLLAACENWAREKGCTEFASDCELINEDSRKFHMAVAFEEANRIICFTKKL
ncbi:MAG: GNAT family N-acetyltransferase [Roseburia sp.]|nr:GNAT family N-acetyltransferase [Roseburia sp.]MCM1098053.1 GNAT family N-acetyltransferase [Ruminococcus flavefaciens]